LKNSIKILSLTIIGLALVISFFGYQLYQLNHNLSILKSNLVLSQETNPNGDNQASQEANNNEVSEQNEEGSGAGGEGASDSQTASQDPITSAFIPDPSSLLSVIIRTSIIALLVFVIVKWLGGKGIGQLSPFGLLIVVGLGSAIGDPMIYNEVSIPQAMVAVIIVVIFFKIIDYLTLRSKRFRESVEPNPILLVDHGQISKIGLEKAKMDKEEFKVEMRLAGIENENEIKFARLEPNGKISFILRNKEKYSNTD
jgi:uncharacterized membrane protein YcaP (DUF421 family)